MGTAAQAEDVDMTGRMIAFLQETALAAVPAVALVQAKLLILDTIGVALAATIHPVGAIIAAHAGEAETRAEATIIGSARRVGAPEAALANGTLANALAFD